MLALAIWAFVPRKGHPIDTGDLNALSVVAASVRTKADGLDAYYRARRLDGRRVANFVVIETAAPLGVRESNEKYRAAYELIMRGIDVHLDVYPSASVQGGISSGGEWGAAPFYPGLVPGGELGAAGRAVLGDKSRSPLRYSTEVLKDRLADITTISELRSNVPFRAGYRHELSVHPDDLNDAYDTLQEMGIRLSMRHHATQQLDVDQADGIDRSDLPFQP